jgi:hypothetical protein
MPKKKIFNVLYLFAVPLCNSFLLILPIPRWHALGGHLRTIEEDKMVPANLCTKQKSDGDSQVLMLDFAAGYERVVPTTDRVVWRGVHASSAHGLIFDDGTGDAWLHSSEKLPCYFIPMDSCTLQWECKHFITRVIRFIVQDSWSCRIPSRWSFAWSVGQWAMNGS